MAIEDPFGKGPRFSWGSKRSRRTGRSSEDGGGGIAGRRFGPARAKFIKRRRERGSGTVGNSSE